MTTTHPQMHPLALCCPPRTSSSVGISLGGRIGSQWTIARDSSILILDLAIEDIRATAACRSTGTLASMEMVSEAPTPGAKLIACLAQAGAVRAQSHHANPPAPIHGAGGAISF